MWICIKWSNKDSFLTGTFHIHCTESIVVMVLLSLIVLHTYLRLWTWRPQAFRIIPRRPSTLPLPCLLAALPQRKHISASVSSSGNRLIGNFNLWLPLHLLQNDLITKWPEFHTLACKEARSSPPSIQHTESPLCLWSDKFGADASLPVGALPFPVWRCKLPEQCCALAVSLF